jgi:hypothetical protein
MSSVILLMSRLLKYEIFILRIKRMKNFVAVCMLLLATGAQALPSYYTGELDGTGSYSDSLNSNSAWVNPPVFGLNSASKDISLWGYNANAGDQLSIDVTSLDDFVGGISIYFGEVSETDLLLGLFNNSASFGMVDFIAGTTTFMADSWLNDIILETAGFYTIFVGGKSGLGWDNAYEYSMNFVAESVATVPEPGAWLLLLGGLFSMAALRRRQQ